MSELIIESHKNATIIVKRRGGGRMQMASDRALGDFPLVAVSVARIGIVGRHRIFLRLNTETYTWVRPVLYGTGF